MKVSEENVNKVCNLVLASVSDENGRGEFDEESDLLAAFEHVISWIEEEE